jgi:hypothetical protein
MAPKNHAIAYGNYGRKKPPPEHFVTGDTKKGNRLQKRPKKIKRP